MSEMSTGRQHGTGRYEIRIQGQLHARWAAWFDGWSLTNDNGGTTVISGLVLDQAALHGLLQKVRDIGLPLISVQQTDPHHRDQPAVAPRQGSPSGPALPPRRTT